MRCTREGLALIQSFESCALSSYKDMEGRWTIGWGRARGVGPGQVCSQAQADAWFAEDVAGFEQLVLAIVDDTPLTDNQLSALVSFVYNEGLGYRGQKDGFQILASGEPSTMLKCLWAKDFPGAAAEFPKWDKAGGVPVEGLLRRRLAEQALFNKPVADGA